MLFEKAGVTSAQYVSTLSGKGTRYKYNETSKLYLKELIGMDTVSLVNFEDVVLHPSNLLSGVEFVAHEEQHSTHYGTGKKGAMLENLPFYIGFQLNKIFNVPCNQYCTNCRSNITNNIQNINPFL